MSVFFLLFGLLAYTRAETCRGVFNNGVAVAPLGVCAQLSIAGVTTSNKLECKDSDAVRETYVTDDCTLVKKALSLDSPVEGIDTLAHDSVECDSALNRCPYVLVRIYTNCDATGAYADTLFAVGVCIPGDTNSQKRVCTDDKIVMETYSGSTTCETDTEPTTETVHESGVCTGGLSYANIIECNTDKAIGPYIAISIMMSLFIITFML